jgi:hypothetical protein
MDVDANDRWPEWVYEAGDTAYLVGPDAAFDLEAGEEVEWTADPSNWGYGGVSMLQVGERLVLTGPFAFLRGTGAMHLAAMDASQDPVEGFEAALSTGAGVTALAEWSGRIVVGGQFDELSGQPRNGLAAFDALTGAADPWAPDAGGQTHPAIRSLAVDPTTDELYVAGYSCHDMFWQCPGLDLGPVARYDAIGDGGALDPSFAPTVACNPVGNSDNGITMCPNVRIGVVRVWAGDVFLGGDFTAINGVKRQGLARLGTDGTLRSWAPALFSQMDPPDTGELFVVDPNELVLDGSRVLISGHFETWQPFGGGAGQVFGKSPLLAYSAAAGTRLYPAPTGDLTGPPSGINDGGYDAAIFGPAIVVAVGRRGALVLDRATFKFDPTANPFLVDKWWASLDGVFALADDPAVDQPAPLVAAGLAVAGLTATQREVLVQTAAANQSIVATVAGSIPRWGLHTAGNMLEAGLRAPDTIAPVAFKPRVAPRVSGTVATTSQPVVVSWPAALETGSGLSRYQLQRSVNGRAWTSVSLSRPAATSVKQKLATGNSYRYRVRAIDRAGNASGWVQGPSVRSTYVAERSIGVRYARTWTTRALAGAVGGSVRSTTTKGASARVSVAGRAFGVVMATGPGRGSVAIYVDGTLAGTVSLKGATRHSARLVFSRTLGAGTHTILVKSLGTARVDLDGFTVVR